MSENISSPAAHRQIWDSLADPEYRRGFSEGHAAEFLAGQIHALRINRGWNQTDLAREAGVSQPQISGWESYCDGIRLSSVFKLAAAFDVGVDIKFIPFSEVARDTFYRAADKNIPSFEDDSPEAIRRPFTPIKFETGTQSTVRRIPSTSSHGQAAPPVVQFQRSLISA